MLSVGQAYRMSVFVEYAARSLNKKEKDMFKTQYKNWIRNTVAGMAKRGLIRVDRPDEGTNFYCVSEDLIRALNRKIQQVKTAIARDAEALQEAEFKRISELDKIADERLNIDETREDVKDMVNVAAEAIEKKLLQIDSEQEDEDLNGDKIMQEKTYVDESRIKDNNAIAAFNNEEKAEICLVATYCSI